MYVCICNGITDSEIRLTAELGITTLDELRDELGVSNDCGRCAECAQKILQQTLNASINLPIHQVAA